MPTGQTTSAPMFIKDELKKLYKKCRVCGSKTNIEFHHLIPNGEHTKGNLVPLCEPCHTRLHAVYEEKMRTATKAQIQNHIEQRKKSEQEFRQHLADINTQLGLLNRQYAEIIKLLLKRSDDEDKEELEEEDDGKISEHK